MFEKSKSGNTVYFRVGIWYDAKKDVIELRSKPDGRHLISTVRADPSLKRGHPDLFEQLAGILRDNGASAPESDGEL